MGYLGHLTANIGLLISRLRVNAVETLIKSYSEKIRVRFDCVQRSMFGVKLSTCVKSATAVINASSASYFKHRSQMFLLTKIIWPLGKRFRTRMAGSRTKKPRKAPKIISSPTPQICFVVDGQMNTEAFIKYHVIFVFQSGYL